MTERNGAAGLVAAFLIAIGLAVGGYFVGHGFTQGRVADNFVSVKGLAEHGVSADLATWALRFTATADDLVTAQAKVEAEAAAVHAFLDRTGFKPEEVEVLRLEVTDLLAQSYRPEGSNSNRFILAETIMVRTNDVQRVRAASSQIGDLVKQDVVLADTGGPQYVFTKLNDIKPGLIAEATANARQAAAQFAKDSGATLGAIRRANQGVIEILGRDAFGDGGSSLAESAQIEKKIRVVVSLDYRLEN
jgi:hypothetical protein